MAKKKKQKPDASTEAESDVEGEEGKKKSGGGFVSKLAMLIALGAASFGTVYLLPRPAPPSVSSEDHESDDHKEDVVLDLTEETAYLELSPMTISLQDELRVLKIGITLETLAGEEGGIDPNDPKIRDAFMGYLRALRLDQIQDAAFMAQMRAQLLRRAQLVLGQDKIRGILITDFLVR